MREEFEIVGSFSKQPIKSFDAQRTINQFEYSDPKAKRGKTLLPTSGLIGRLTIPVTSGGWRASFVFQEFVYFVVEDRVFRASANLAPEQLGLLTTNNDFVGIEANTFQVIFVDGVKGYIFDTTTGVFVEITAPGFPAKPLDVAFLDGFFIVAAGETNSFTLSDLNQGLNWDALNTAAINTHPGTITAIQTLHRKLFIFAQTFCEVWENAGIADFPLRRNNSLLIEYGTISPASVVTGFDTMFFLSQDREGLGHVIMVNGSQAIPISNSALDYELNQYTTISDAKGMVVQDWGIVFYRLNFTVADKTWVFNVSQSTPDDFRWHNEEMLDGSRHVAETHFYLNEKHYYGAYNSGKLYEISNTTYTNDGEAIKRERVSKTLFDPKGNRIRVDRLFLDLVQGEALSNGVDANPIVYLAVSRDGGRSYGNELTAPMGKIGQREFITRFRKLGAARTFNFRIRFYNELKFVMLGASIDMELLPE